MIVALDRAFVSNINPLATTSSDSTFDGKKSSHSFARARLSSARKDLMIQSDLSTSRQARNTKQSRRLLSTSLRSSTPSAQAMSRENMSKSRNSSNNRKKNVSLLTKRKAFGQQQQQEDSSSSSDNDDTTLVSASGGGSDMSEVALWVAGACLFGAGIGYFQGADKASEYFAGYLLEQSLSVDNLFVFILVFDYFKVPESTQPKVLSFGIIGAMIMRAFMIVAGATAIEDFEPVLLVFAGILIFSSYKLLAANADEDEEEDLKDSAIVKFCTSMIPVSDEYDGDNFWTTAKNGVDKIATPLLLVVAVIELSDVVFAVDSIPAVFGVTKDPFIVYTSNIFAICGLRSLFGFVSAMVSELEYLQTAVAVVLGFIGVKMVADYGGYSMSTEASLGVVATLLSGGVAASYLFPSSAAKEASVDEN